MADIETFEALRNFVEAERLLQRLEALILRLLVGDAALQILLRRDQRELLPFGAIAAQAVADLHLAPARTADCLVQRGLIRQRRTHEQFARNIVAAKPAQIMLQR